MFSQLTKSYIKSPEFYPENYGSLILNFQGISLEIFKIFKKPQKNIIGVTVEYSFAGNPLVKRNYGVSKKQWDVSCLLDIEGYDRFLAIAHLHDNYINENFDASPEDYSIIVNDYLNPVVEKGTSPSRAFAEGATDIKILENNEAIRYFARFYAALNLESISQNRKGPWWEVEFSMQENE